MCTICSSLRPLDPGCIYQGVKSYAVVTEGADASDTVLTTYSISPGDTFSGSYGNSFDTDFVSITLAAGQTYDITLMTYGDPDLQPDAYLQVLDSNGNVLAFNDDISINNVNSSLLFTAADTGTYFISIGQYEFSIGEPGYAGLYSLDVLATGGPGPGSTAFVATTAEFANQLITGYWNGSGFGGQPQAFDVEAGGTLYVDMSRLNADGRTLATEALGVWSLTTGLTFSTTTPFGTQADIVFDDADPGGYSTSITNGADTILSSTVNIGLDWIAAYGTGITSYTFQTYVHEIGHALGLGHAGNYNGNANFSRDALFLNDSWQMSVMSYFDQEQNTQIDATVASVITPMMADVYAMALLYGTPTTLRTGNTTYGENSTAGGAYDRFSTINSDGDISESVTMTIVDSGGTDTLDFRSDTVAQRIDLRSGSFSDVYGQLGTLAIAVGTVIENAMTGSGHDVIYGNDAANQIQSMNGDDRVDAGAGNDFVQGGFGRDTVSGGFGFDTIEGNAANDLIDGGGQADALYGGDGNDTVLGDQGFDVVSGNAGNDSLYGGTDEDWMFGGTDNDVVYGGTGTDFLYGGVGFDSIYGDEGNDRITGEGQADALYGGDGNDTIFGDQGFDIVSGNAGNDSLYGGTEEDWMFGGFDNDRVYGGAGTDFLFGGVGFDTLYGGDGNDRLTGEAQADHMYGDTGNDTLLGDQGVDWLDGGADNDLLFGGTENDTLTGGLGNDTLYGGDGADHFVFAMGSGADILQDFALGVAGEVIDLIAYATITGFADVQAALSMVGANSVIDLGGGDSITLVGIDQSSLVVDHFVFA